MKFFLFLILWTEKKYDELEKIAGIFYVRESQKKNTMSLKKLPASFTCGRAKMPSRSLALAAGAITYHNFHHKTLVRPENKIDKDLNL